MKKLKRICLTLFILLAVFRSSFSKEYNILSFGAVADTVKLSTSAIQAAIDECSRNGGGRVIVPAGSFATGSIILKNNVNLYLEAGAVLYGSRNIEDYKKLYPGYASLRTRGQTLQLVYAENARNISITGYGEINGRGNSFEQHTNDEGITRPHLLRFITCENIIIENIILKNSGCWMQHYLACDKIRISGIKIFNRNNYNNDGLDLDGCHDVFVSDVVSDSDDDGITMKSTSPRLCENITITNCIISSRCNAIKMGTETNGGFKNIAISNCVVKPSEAKVQGMYGLEKGISGIALEIVDGGVMGGISIDNIRIDGTESPIFIRLANRARPYKSDIAIDYIGKLGDISISNISIKNSGKTGCSITGQPGFPVKNIRLNNFVIEQKGGGMSEDALKSIEDKPKDYPEATMFGTLPAFGFYIHHASGITLDGIQISTINEDFRPTIYLDNVDGCTLGNIQFQGNKKAGADIWLKESRDISVKGCVVKGESVCFVKLDGGLNSNISVVNNLLGNTVQVFSKGSNPGQKIFEQYNTKSE